MLKGVLALEELASRVVSFTDATGVQRGLGTQNLVTAHRLNKSTHTINMHDQNDKLPHKDIYVEHSNQYNEGKL